MRNTVLGSYPKQKSLRIFIAIHDYYNVAFSADHFSFEQYFVLYLACNESADLTEIQLNFFLYRHQDILHIIFH
jgi:hypothetical protein